MEYCKQCLMYIEHFSEFVAADQDSTPKNEKPKEHFCMMFDDGIPDGVWNGAEKCAHMIPKSE